MTETAAPFSEEKVVPWWLVLIEGIAAVIIGLMLLAKPGMTTAILVQIVGIYWFIAGILSIVSIFIDSSAWGWKLIIGILGILAGLLIIRHPLYSTFLVPTTLIIILGIEGIIIGAINIFRAFKGAGWGAGILGALSIIFGILLLANPAMGALALPFVLGIFAIVGGIMAVVAAFRMK
ncbi:MAG TPA: HdeD family acid-resistance protein [Patescibacteria group bacterium]|nr:HdeD family acid-resistance protein [Patescibacteria group bacterium]